MRRIYAMLATLGLLIASCGYLYAQPPYVYVTRPEYEGIQVLLVDSIVINKVAVEGIDGVMQCNKANKPVVLILKSLWATPEFEVTRRHEMQHVKQAEPDCKRFLKHYKDDASFRFQCELDAYMTEATLSGNPLSIIETITDQLMFQYYNFPYSRDSVRTRVKSRFPP